MSYRHLMEPRLPTLNAAPLYTQAENLAFLRRATEGQKRVQLMLIIFWLRVGWNARLPDGRIPDLWRTNDR